MPRQSSTVDEPPPAMALSLAPSLMFVFHVGGLISPALCTVGYLRDDLKVAWMGVSFFIYSWLCVLTTATSNPRKIGTRSEITRISLAFSCECLGLGLAGACIKTSEHRLTKTLGWTAFVFGFVFTVLAPFINLHLVATMNKRFTDKRLNSFILAHLTQNPATILSSLYLSTGASKAILNAEDGVDLLVICGNPIVPTFLLNMFIWLTFILSILFNFEANEYREVITLDAIVSMKVPFKIQIEIYTYSFLGLLALVIFALTEDDDNMTDWDRPLYRLFTLVFTVVLTCLLFFESHDKIGRHVFDKGSGKVESVEGGDGRGEVERKGSHAELLFHAHSIIPA